MRRCLALLLLLSVVGCSTNAPLPDVAHQSSAIDYTQALRRATSAGLDSVLAQIPSPANEFPDYRVWEDFWCPRHAEISSVQAVKEKLAGFCLQSGGVYRAPYCRIGTSDSVLFYAMFLNTSRCQNVTETVDIRIIEPKPGKIDSAGYLAALQRVGFQSRAAVAQQQREAQAQREDANRQQRVDQERVARELPLLRTGNAHLQ
jgi:hypothetical protein